jgi:hypothetical protein
VRVQPETGDSAMAPGIGDLRASTGQPQDWQHRAMPKGLVSERDLNPRVHDLRVRVAI